MRREILRMSRPDAVALLGRASIVHLASTNEQGAPLVRALNAVVVRDAIAFHASPVGEKTETIGREAVVVAEEIVASVPSYFIDPERACPATTLYLSAQVHGAVREVTDPAHRAEVLAALMAKYQPEGGHVPIAHDHPLYAKAIRGLLIAEIPLERLDGKAKVAQNRPPEERRLVCEGLWRRGLPTDPRAIDLVLAASPDTPTPGFLACPVPGVALRCAPDEADAVEAAELVAGAYWNADMTVETLVKAHLGAAAWVVAKDEGGRVVATARAISDGAKRAWIYDVAVAEALRGKGLGAAVMKLLLDHPRVRHARTVSLGTRDAQAFYGRLGFEEASVALARRPFTSTTMMLSRGGTMTT